MPAVRTLPPARSLLAVSDASIADPWFRPVADRLKSPVRHPANLEDRSLGDILVLDREHKLE